MQDRDASFEIFARGEAISSLNFQGAVWLKMLAEEPLFNCGIGNVTFGPGARNCWHRHPGGQILLVTSGRGLYQERGKSARRLRRGDVVEILPGVEHWHGAAPDGGFAHISITANPGLGAPEWLAPASDLEYAEAAR